MPVNSNPTYVLKLYIADKAPNSVRARGNLRAFCRSHLPDSHQVEIIDVFADPARALAEGIFMTPTLIKLLPLPVRRIVGNLSDPGAIREALDMEDDGTACD
jgi:circadian clock protein KaiB